ncbi:hydroxymethylglutaryl-CoA lyase [Stenotrophomonas sp. SY1]|uniref:hydroxymethylglutaryl-CoA lyase n=1 Tax=Stenotrophomonas sp. SY1 TaxID=477235 RepID=UPI001E445AE5|nr:hydroxymethylglutaryl-CoA lyase [Stenotrophomonas sp. SY1]MCD9088682.1 hydroxymethylglutaryl-CoA lyase [Stenotrophomonas sp. SY1]
MDAALELMDTAHVVELGAREGLLGLPRTVDTLIRVNLIGLLELAGIGEIEVGAFALPRGLHPAINPVPLLDTLGKPPVDNVRSVLLPHLNTLDAAFASGCQDITVSTTASQMHCRASLGCNIEESLRRIEEICIHAQPLGIRVRARISAVVDCPFSGAVTPAQVAVIVARLQQIGCRQICLDDTTGTGTPSTVGTLLRACLTEAPMHRLACHFHDTFGLGLANVVEALEQGVRTFDSSISGLGGNPYLPDAAGNLATEELVHLLTQLGIESGVDMEGLILAGDYIDCMLERRTESRVGRALRARKAQQRTRQ